MKISIQQSRLASLLKQRNGFLVLASGLLMLCLLQLGFCFYCSGHERVVLVPPEIQRPFWVSAAEVSADYLSQMSVFFAYLRLNETPESAEGQHQLLLRYTDPKYYGILNNVLTAEREQMVSQHLSTAFYPVGIKVDTQAMTTDLTGDLVSMMGADTLKPQRVRYHIQYDYNNGRLWVMNFQEVRAHD